MADLLIELEVDDDSMDAVRPRLDAALTKNFPGGMLQRRWDGDVLHLTGPGAKGTITYDGGKLIGRASLKPPASLMKTMIEEKISGAMRDVASA